MRSYANPSSSRDGRKNGRNVIKKRKLFSNTIVFPTGNPDCHMVVNTHDKKACLVDPDVARCLRSGDIDAIGDFMTEINVTSPTGIQEIDRFDGVSLESDIWDAIEKSHAEVHKA